MVIDILAFEYRAEFQSVYAWIICVAALVFGGGPERAFAMVWLILFKIVDGIYHAFVEQSYQMIGVDVFHASLDAIALVVWVAIALFANRNYPLWIAAMQLLAVVAHLARGLVESIAPVAFAVMAFAPGYFQLAFITVGLVRHLLRKREYGSYRDWRVVRARPGRFPFKTQRNQMIAMLGYEFFSAKGRNS